MLLEYQSGEENFLVFFKTNTMLSSSSTRMSIKSEANINIIFTCVSRLRMEGLKEQVGSTFTGRLKQGHSLLIDVFGPRTIYCKIFEFVKRNYSFYFCDLIQ